MADDADLTARLISLREVLESQIAALERLCTARMDGQDAARLQYLAMLGDERAGLDRRIQSVRERAESLNDAMQLQVDQRLAGDRRLLDERYATQKSALDAALVAAEKAVGRAETAADKRFDAVNEFRKTLADQTATFLPRSEYDAGHLALADRATANADRITALELRLTSRLDRGEGADLGQAGQRTEQRLNISQVIAAAAALVAIITVILYATKK